MSPLQGLVPCVPPKDTGCHLEGSADGSESEGISIFSIPSHPPEVIIQACVRLRVVVIGSNKRFKVGLRGLQAGSGVGGGGSLVIFFLARECMQHGRESSQDAGTGLGKALPGMGSELC